MVTVALAFASPAFAQLQARKLSDILLERRDLENVYLLGLSWQVPAQMPPQKALQFDLQKRLAGIGGLEEAAKSRMRQWLNDLPVTGRVPVAVPDIRWLQANPSRDPLVQPGDSVVLPLRPTTVTLIKPDASLCEVTHVPGRNAQAYMEACQGPGGVDWIWIAQPDGRVQRFGMALWNRQQQDEPAPGAWLWAPTRRSGWPEDFTSKLIEFLATQGPAQSSRSPSSIRRLEVKPEGFSNRWFAPPANSQVTANDWGAAGLLQTPSARMNRPGYFAFTLSRATPYRRANIFFQPLDWFEAGFRYSFIGNRAYDPSGVISDLSYVDKSFDAKVKLVDELAYIPQLAVGVNDLTGTGLFSGEYFVASKQMGAFDWSLGLGWGYTGGRGDMRNPLRLLGRREVRVPFTGQPGSFSLGNFFAGPSAWFGGVQYQTPWQPLTLKLEYDGNNYQNEPQGNNQVQKSPWNLGAVYRLGDAADISLALERGNTVMLGLTLRTDISALSTPKINDLPRVPVVDTRPIRANDWASTVRAFSAQTEWEVGSITQKDGDLHVSINDPGAMYWRDRVDKAAAVLHRDAPVAIERFVLSYRERGLEVAEHVINRDSWVKEQLQPLPPRDRAEPVMERAPQFQPVEWPALYKEPRRRFEFGLGPHYQQTLGGPDGFILFQAGVIGRATFRVRDDTWLQGSLQMGLVDNYDKFKFTAPSNLPRVRTFLREYFTASDITMPNLQATHVGRLGANHFYSAYAGYLETMFAGAGAEWLYRPFGSRIAFGIDINSVQQRDFEQNIGLRDYKAKTGHATLYWDTGWNDIQATISVGQYLAGDKGVTLNLSRGFQNGVRIGAFATKTDVSSEQFGEGSFDKGIYVSIPFDAFLTKTSRSMANFVWKPLTRDGGAMLGRAVTLYDITSPRDPRVMTYRPAPLDNAVVIPSDRREPWISPPQSPAPFSKVVPRPTAEQWGSAGRRYEHRLGEALYSQQFRNVAVTLDLTQRLSIEVSNEQLRPASLAVGRAARTALQMGPLDLREIRVLYSDGIRPLVVYEFVDLKKLERFFGGELNEAGIADTVRIEYLNPAARESNPLVLLRDVNTEISLRTFVEAVLPDSRMVGRIGDDFIQAGRKAKEIDWLRTGAIGSGLVLGSSLLDRRAFSFARDRADAPWLKAGVKFGNAIPLFGMGVAALAALDESDAVRSRTGYAALEAGGVSILAATGLKYLVGRERPGGPNGNTGFKPFSSSSNNDSFPSRHVIVSWAVATPFAEEYNMPWLYGVAALTNLARIGSREHWVSDTLAGSLLGYGIGRLFHDASRKPLADGPRLTFSSSGAALAWPLK